YRKSRGQENSCSTGRTTTGKHEEHLYDTWQGASIKCFDQLSDSDATCGEDSTSPRFSTKAHTKRGFTASTAASCSCRRCAHDCAQVFKWPVASVGDSAWLVSSLSEQATSQCRQSAAVSLRRITCRNHVSAEWSE
ncbi:hypothetical protein MTO96_032182, partial [Rhipicephalus appendiculatus]